MKKIIFIVLFGLQFFNANSQYHTITNWELVPSFKNDAMCFINILTNDHFYVRNYKKEFKVHQDLITPEVKSALNTIRDTMKIKHQQIISAWLTIYFSATNDESMDELLSRIDHINLIKENLKKANSYNDEAWNIFVSILPELKITFQFLKEIEFEKYWEREIRPVVEKRILEMEQKISNNNIISEIERKLGKPFDSDTIKVYVLYFAQPHGIKITGTRFITDVSYSDKTVMNNAVHELLHSLDLQTNKETAKVVAELKNDPVMMDKLENHNPSFGYNTFEGYVEENCVKALDEIINSRYGFTEFKNAKKRWRRNDGGMHVLAAVLHELMVQENFLESDELYEDFIVRMIQEDRIVGEIK